MFTSRPSNKNTEQAPSSPSDSSITPSFPADYEKVLGQIGSVFRFALLRWTVPTNQLYFKTYSPELDLPVLTTWEDILHDDDRGLFVSSFARSISQRSNDFSLHCRLRTTSGNYLPVFFESHVEQRSPGGTPALVTGFVRMAEEESKARPSTAHTLNNEHSRFLANMSHEIRTPINGILGMTELALDCQPDPELKKYLHRIRSCSVTLMQVLDDILDYSKAENGKLQFSIAPLSIRTIVKDVLDLFAIDAYRKGLDLACWIDSHIPDWLMGDPGRIRQVLINLVGNALKFTAKGEIVLSIAAIASDAHGITLAIRVSDTGRGIPQDKLTSIFEPFVQVDSTISRTAGGTGLGLSICKYIVEGLGGSISVKSSLDRGSLFTVELTLGYQAASPNEKQSPATSIDPRSRILLSVAKPATARTLISSLKSMGYVDIKVAPTLDGTKENLALAHSSSEPFDIWFIDSDLFENDSSSPLHFFAKLENAAMSRCILVSNVLRFASDTRISKKLGIPSRLQTPALDHEIQLAIAQIHQGNSLNEVIEYNPEQISEAEAQANVQPGGKVRILIVEDDPTNLEVIQTALERSGYAVDTACGGAEALEKFEQRPYDLIIMDIQMPGVDGISATEAIRLKETRRSWVFSPDRESTLIIGLSADIQSSVRNAALAAGMNEILTKPISRKKLLEAIKKMLSEERPRLNPRDA